jgi:hypothetical protein
MRTRLYVAGIFGALALLAIALVVVIQFGRHNPSPPLLKDHPRSEIPGEILYQDRDGCFVVAEASGAGATRYSCPFQQGPVGTEFWWVDETHVQWVYRTGPTDGRVMEVDIVTGQQRDTGEQVSEPDLGFKGPFPPAPGLNDCQEALDGTFACIDRDGKLAIAEGGTVTRVAEFDLPEYSRPHVKGWSPDSQWVVLEYYGQRAQGPELWIVSRDGAVRGTLVKDISFTRIAWRIDGVGVWPELPE